MKWTILVLLLTPAAVALIVFAIGRIPREGFVAAIQPNDQRVEAILRRNGISSWTGHSISGGTGFNFPIGTDLWRVHGQLVADAQEHGYWVKIRYKARLRVFDSTYIVDL